jgi:sulfatase maturation enzyme AslB (radical SAM superfamily)
LTKDLLQSTKNTLAGSMISKQVSRDTFCILPWIHFFGSENGNIYPCCISLDDNLPNIDDQGRPFLISEPGHFDAAWNSNYMRDIRKKMMHGERPAPCSRCYKFEDAGIRSHRESSNNLYGAHRDMVLLGTHADGWAPPNIRTADIRLGNICNLKCRMCSPNSSRALIKEWRELYPSVGEKYLQEAAAIDWFEQDGFWNIFEKYVPSLEALHFAGGEPLLIPKMYEFLRKIVSLGYSRQITLTYNTNLTVFPDELYELWPQFAGVKVMVSLDGYQEVNRYIRYPSNWDKIHENLLKLDRDYEKLRCTYVNFNITVQNYNILRLVELLDYIHNTFKNVNRLPLLSLLFHPDSFSIQALPLDLKLIVKKKIQEYVLRVGDQWPQMARYKVDADNFSRNIEGVIHFMMEKDRSSLMPEFQRITEIYDRNRSQKLLEVLPEFAPYITTRLTETRPADMSAKTRPSLEMSQ